MNNVKFCSKCGAPLSENEKFCGKCGTPVAEMQMAGNAPQQPTAQQVQPTAQPVQPQQPNFAAQQPVKQKSEPGAAGVWVKNHIPLLSIIAAAVVLIIVAIIIICNIFKYQVIDAKDLFRIDFKGLNSCGTAISSLNNKDSYESAVMSNMESEDSFYSYDDYDKIGDLKDSEFSNYLSSNKSDLEEAWTKAGSRKKAEKMRDYLLDKKADLKIKLDKDKNLSNGDKIKCTVKYDEDYLKKKEIKLKDTEFEIEVKGLEDGEKIDLFAGINVSFEGSDGLGYAVVDSADDAINFISYSYDYEKTRSYSASLSNGDKFAVTATVSHAKKAGDKYWCKSNDKYYIFDKEEDTKEYEVSGLKELEGIDPFEGIKFRYSYASPYLYIKGVDDSSDISDKLDGYRVYYEIEDGVDLKPGDTFKVKAYMYSTDAEKLADDGYKLAGDKDEDGYITKEYTVDDKFPTYVNADDAAAAEKALAGRFTTAIRKIKSDKFISFNVGDGYYSYRTISSVDYVESYVRTNKAESESNIDYYDAKADIVSIYKITGKDSDGKKRVCYYGIIVSNPYLLGTTYKTDSSSTGRISAKTLKAIEDHIKDGAYDTDIYNVTKYNKNKAAAKPAADDSSSKAEDSSLADESSSATDSSSAADSSSSSSENE